MLHPQARALLDLFVQRGIPPTESLAPPEARKLYRERRSATQPEPPAVGQVQALRAKGPNGLIALRLYRPSASAAKRPDDARGLPVLVYFHGGGWVIGDLDTHDTLCRELANGAGCAVVSVDYRLAPEHRFPAAVDDCFAATQFVRREAAVLGLDPARLAVGGDSAGGNLAAVVALLARDPAVREPAARDSAAGERAARHPSDLRIACQLLIYPATDMRRTAPSHTNNGHGYLLTAATMAYFHDHYIADPAHDLDWRASPLLHPDLSKLPPALVITAGFDPLRDEGLAYAEALTAAGNRCAHVCFERQIHGFITMGKVLDEAQTAVALCCGELRRAFGS